MLNTHAKVPARPVSGSGPRPRVTVLLALHCGEAHLPAQLASLKAQAGVDWRLMARDDASTDDTANRVARFRDEHPGRVFLSFSSPRQGFARNFLSLLAECPADGSLIALCDQDDVWHPEKLARAALALSRMPKGSPAMVCGRVRVCDRALRPTGAVLPPGAVRPSFGNALVENIAYGNTIVLNAEAAALARRTASAAVAAGVFAHDWWLYLLVTGCGGAVLFDPEPLVLYRQHGANALGAPTPRLRSFGDRIGRILDGRIRNRIDANLTALSSVRSLLTVQNRARLDGFVAARKSRLPARLVHLRALGLDRHDLAGRLGFWGAAVLGRI